MQTQRHNINGKNCERSRIYFIEPKKNHRNFFQTGLRSPYPRNTLKLLFISLNRFSFYYTTRNLHEDPRVEFRAKCLVTRTFSKSILFNFRDHSHPFRQEGKEQSPL